LKCGDFEQKNFNFGLIRTIRILG